MGIFTPKVAGKKELAEADQLVKAGKYDEAIEKAKQGLKEIRKSGKQSDIAYANATVLTIQGQKEEKEENLENAAGAFGQAVRYYQQAKSNKEMRRVCNKQIKLLKRIGQRYAKDNKFDSAASTYEKAAISCKEINLEVDALELRAKAFVFRAASVRDPSDRKEFLLKAVRLIEDSGLDKPIVQGHLKYYSAMVERMSDKNKAIESLNEAIEFYNKAGNQAMIRTAKAMKDSIRRSD